MNAHCFYCQQTIEPSAASTLQRVTGWQQRNIHRISGARGGSDILLRRAEPDVFAHKRCVEDVRRGVIPGQQTLV